MFEMEFKVLTKYRRTKNYIYNKDKKTVLLFQSAVDLSDNVTLVNIKTCV